MIEIMLSSAMPETSDLAQLWNSDMIVLELPDSPRADMTRVDPKSTVLVRTNFEDGQLLLVLDANQPRKLVAVAVSPQLVDRIDLSKLEETGDDTYGGCWDKPTNAGVIGCVLEAVLQRCCS